MVVRIEEMGSRLLVALLVDNMAKEVGGWVGGLATA
jgi:hypothetical protein